MNATIDNDTVWQALRAIPDPEYGISIVDMGLIYEVECLDGDIVVIMTLTTPNCPSGEWIYEGVKTAVNNLEGAKKVAVEMVFEPPCDDVVQQAIQSEQSGQSATGSRPGSFKSMPSGTDSESVFNRSVSFVFPNRASI